MLDIKFVQENKDLIKKTLVERGINKLDLDPLFSLDNKRKELSIKLDFLRKKKKAMTSDIEILATTNNKSDQGIIEKIRYLNKHIDKFEKEKTLYEQKIREFLVNLPNIAHPSVPEGFPGEPNKLVFKSGEMPQFDFSPLTYLEIGKRLDIIDFSESLSKLDFDVIFYKGIGAGLQRGLINFLMDLHIKRKYCEMAPPVLADGWPILRLLQGRVFDEDELPIVYVNYSLCFRKDWTFAQDIKNDLKRIRQFDSIECIKISNSKDSYEILEDAVEEVKEKLNLLELPYEVYLFTRGNLDYISNKAYSIKVFLPGLGTFLEISVCSNLTDFFSKDMGICYRDRKLKTKEYAHIVHVTNLIIPRAIMSILENFQQEDGSVLIPKVLRPYLNGLDKISVKK